MEIQSIHEFDTLLKHYGLMDSGVEVGVAEGRTSLEFLNFGIEKLYLIDNWATIEGQSGDGSMEQEWHDNNYNGMLERTKEFSDRVIILKGMSVEMAKQIPDNSLGFAYVDAGHTKKNALEDLQAITPKVRIGGIVAGHDFLNTAYGVRAAVEEFCKDKYEIHVIPEKSIENAGFWFQKTSN